MTFAGQGGTFTNNLTIDTFNSGRYTTGTVHPTLNVDEMAFWLGTSLTSQNVTNIYNNGIATDLVNTANVPSPTIYYRFEDASNQNYETISNSNSGTIVSGVTTNYP